MSKKVDVSLNAEEIAMILIAISSVGYASETTDRLYDKLKEYLLMSEE